MTAASKYPSEAVCVKPRHVYDAGGEICDSATISNEELCSGVVGPALVGLRTASWREGGAIIDTSEICQAGMPRQSGATLMKAAMPMYVNLPTRGRRLGEAA